MASLPLPLPLPIPTEPRKAAKIPGAGAGAEPVEVLVEKLGDVEGIVVVLDCVWLWHASDVFAEYLIARLLNLGAERIEFAGITDEYWPTFVAAAERLGVPDRIRNVDRVRLVGAG